MSDIEAAFAAVICAAAFALAVMLLVYLVMA